MKNLITFIFVLALTASVNAQDLSIGTDNVQIGVSSIGGSQSLYGQASFTSDLIWKINTKLSVSAGVLQTTEKTFVKNGDTKRYNGGIDDVTQLKISPSAMIGVDIPVDDFKIGLYSGYRTDVTNTINHRFVPLSVSLNF